jgi:hypothetical protein
MDERQKLLKLLTKYESAFYNGTLGDCGEQGKAVALELQLLGCAKPHHNHPYCL